MWILLCLKLYCHLKHEYISLIHVSGLISHFQLSETEAILTYHVKKTIEKAN